VPEGWRLDAAALTFYVPQADVHYAAAPISCSLPTVSASDVAGFLALLGQQAEYEILRQFRAWVRRQHGVVP
jgi:hypothetical protein